MDPLEALKTTFMSNHNNYFYNVMPFRLKNAHVTYQRLMYVVLSCQIGCIMKVYIENMIVSTLEEGSHYRDLKDILESTTRYNMHLNPSKCSFGV